MRLNKYFENEVKLTKTNVSGVIFYEHYILYKYDYSKYRMIGDFYVNLACYSFNYFYKYHSVRYFG